MKFSRALLHVSIESQFVEPAECQIGGLMEYEGGQGYDEKAAGARTVTGHLLSGAWSRRCQRRAKKGQSAV